jgi:alkylated DNA nucleotide flippase Atl1
MKAKNSMIEMKEKRAYTPPLLQVPLNGKSTIVRVLYNKEEQHVQPPDDSVVRHGRVHKSVTSIDVYNGKVTYGQILALDNGVAIPLRKGRVKKLSLHQTLHRVITSSNSRATYEPLQKSAGRVQTYRKFVRMARNTHNARVDYIAQQTKTAATMVRAYKAAATIVKNRATELRLLEKELSTVAAAYHIARGKRESGGEDAFWQVREERRNGEMDTLQAKVEDLTQKKVQMEKDRVRIKQKLLGILDQHEGTFRYCGNTYNIQDAAIVGECLVVNNRSRSIPLESISGIKLTNPSFWSTLETQDPRLVVPQKTIDDMIEEAIRIASSRAQLQPVA